jgi:hypothetical protein
LGQQLQAVGVRQFDIQQDDVGLFLGKSPKEGGSVLGSGNLAILFQQRGQDRALVTVVINN